MIKVIYNKTCGRCVQSEPLTSGMVGQPIHFEYSHDFDGLSVTAVFTDGKNTVDVVNPGNECIIPHDVLTTVGAMVKVGIYATRGDELVIPTVYATIGVVQKGADPSGDVSIDPTLPVWAQIEASIGNLNALETEAKDNLVVAVNEVKHTADGKQDKLIAGENITISADGKTISATGGGGGTVPKPLTYDYMPEGYPSKTMGTVTVMEEQELAFVLKDYGFIGELPTTAPAIVAGKTYTVNWDGTEYECVCFDFNSYPTLGNLSIMGAGGDTGEPFIYVYNTSLHAGNFATLDRSPTHTISVKTTGETITPMAEEFIPTTAKLPNPNAITFTGAVTGTYDGSAPLSVEIPSGGGSGSDISLGLTGATVGQIAKITAVDDTGKPTAWAPVDMPTGAEYWEKIADIDLRSDTSKYVLADFGVWRKAKVIMTRPRYISGLQKNVWARVMKRGATNGYNCGYINSSYGYVYWEFATEVDDLFISSTSYDNNNPNVAVYIKSTRTLTPLDGAPSEYEFILLFEDTSVIQEGDRVTVIGVKR